MIVIIATVYEINEYLVEKAEEGRSGAVALVVGTLLAFALAVTLHCEFYEVRLRWG